MRSSLPFLCLKERVGKGSFVLFTLLSLELLHRGLFNRLFITRNSGAKFVQALQESCI